MNYAEVNAQESCQWHMLELEHTGMSSMLLTSAAHTPDDRLPPAPSVRVAAATSASCGTLACKVMLPLY